MGRHSAGSGQEIGGLDCPTLFDALHALHLRLAGRVRPREYPEKDQGRPAAAAQGKHIGRPKGLDAENLAKVRKALEKGLSVAETVELTSIRPSYSSGGIKLL